MNAKEFHIRSRNSENVSHRGIDVHWYGEEGREPSNKALIEACLQISNAQPIVLPRRESQFNQEHEVLNRMQIVERLTNLGADKRTAMNMTQRLPSSLMMSIFGFLEKDVYVAIVEYPATQDHRIKHPFIVRVANAANAQGLPSKLPLR